MRQPFSKFIVLIAVLSLLASSAAVFAQGNSRHEPIPFERQGFSVPGFFQKGAEKLHQQRPGKPDLTNPETHVADNAIKPEIPQVLTGEPGVTFSHVETFGEADTAYFEDTQHYVYPNGVGTADTSVWIADSDGNRALKFDGSGNWQQTIGNAGYIYYDIDGNYPLAWVTDVTVDNEGDVWLVDGACYLLEFSTTGVLSDTLGSPWDCGSGDYQFDRPESVAFDASGNIYVSDYWNHRVMVYDSAKNPIYTIGGTQGSGDNNFNRPGHIAIYGTTLYVADSRNHRIQMFNISNPQSILFAGSLGTQGGGDYQFGSPLGVAVNASYLFVANSWNDRVQVFNRVGLTYATTIGGSGSGSGQFTYPTDVAVDTSGNLFVADNENHRVQKFTSGFSFNRIYGTTDVPYLTDASHYHGPAGVTVEPDGEILIAEADGSRIVKIKGDGEPVWTFGAAGVCMDDNDHLCGPQDVDVAPDGKIYVSDTWNNRVVVLSSGGIFQTAFGTYGDQTGQFDGAYASALDNKNNLIYVVDRGNNRVQVFNRTSFAFVAQFGGYGAANGLFRSPQDIAIDSSGQIYVVDRDNHRVQVFDSNRQYVGSIGVSGSVSDAYNRLSNPVAVAVDSKDRVFIAESWGGRIKVYDKTGAFLDCIYNGWDSFQGMFRSIQGLGTDVNGNLYTADGEAHQVKRFAPGAYPGWRQVNTTGMGEHYNWAVWSMTVYSDTLYVSVAPYYDMGAKLYKYENGTFTNVMSGGFGDTDNIAIDSFESFEGKLYAGTWNEDGNYDSAGGQLFRTVDPDVGPWENVATGGFDNADNSEIMALQAFGEYLYAGTYSYYLADPEATIWRSDTGDLDDWDEVFSNSTPGYANAAAITDMIVFGDALYAATTTNDGGGELWRTTDGTTWIQVNTSGFGDPNNISILSLEVFDGNLYAGTDNLDDTNDLTYGGELYRSSNGTTWDAVMEGGFGDPENWGVGGLVAYRGFLYAVTDNSNTGAEVWRSATGDENTWEKVGAHAFGKEWVSAFTLWNNNHAVHDDVLYLGTFRQWGIGGGRIWSFMPDWVYLPLITK